MEKHVIIIGAGAAGLMAARELAGYCRVTVLEAGEESGGRIKTFTMSGLPHMLDAGAEFIHGKLPLTMGLLKESQTNCVSLEGKMYGRREEGWHEQEEMFVEWDDLMKKMKSVKKDMTVNEFLHSYFPEPKYAQLRKHMIAYAEGFDVADPATASVKALYKEWSHEGESFRIPSGYGAIIEYLEAEIKNKNCTVIKGDAVTDIGWKENAVIIKTSKEKIYTAEKVLITVPVIHLRGGHSNRSINFLPEITKYNHAFTNIGYGTVVKVVILFKKPLWKQDAGFIFSDEQIPTWWTLLPIRSPVLTGWAGGPVADKLSGLSDSQILETALLSLSNILAQSSEYIRDSIVESAVFNWKTFANAGGAYSFSMLESDEARKLLNTPLVETIYFAGEALYEGDYPGTVEAALETGKSAAARIRKSIQ